MNLLLYLIFFFFGLKVDNISLTDKKRNSNNYIYSIFIFILITIQPIYLLYRYIKYNEINLLPSIFFMLIPGINMIVVLYYFKKPHFNYIYTDIINKKRSKHKLINNIMNEKLIIFLFIILLIFSFILNYVFIDYKSVYLIHYLDSHSNYYIPLYIFTFIINIYSKGISFLNLLIFLFVFLKHYIDIKEECDKIESDLTWDRDNNQTSLSIICFNILWIRNELDKSIYSLENIYISNTLLGALSIGIILNTRVIDLYSLISMILWGIMQFLFLLIIFGITKERTDLNKALKKPKFCAHYIIRKYEESGTPLIELINKIDDKRRKEYIKERTSPELNKNNYDYEEDIENNLNCCESLNQDINDLKDINKIIKEDNKYIKNGLMQSSSTLDWLVLYTLVSEPWATFSLFTIKFQDGDGIKKALGITALIIFLFKFLFGLTLEL